MSLIPLVSILGLIFTVPEAVQAVPNGGYARPEVLIQPEELKALVDKKDPNIRIIDIREKLKYLADHIPGAVHIWRRDRDLHLLTFRVRSAHSLVSLYLVGYPLEKLHNDDGSWIEWSRSSEAIETGPPIQ